MTSLGPTGERALFRSVSAWGVEQVSADLGALERGFHALVMTFEGELVAARMGQVVHHPDDPWAGSRLLHAPVRSSPSTARWDTSLDEDTYRDGVRRIRRHIADGTVYQVNLCRVLRRELDDAQDRPEDMDALFLDVLAHNPAPHAARLDIAGHLDVVSASPELYLRRDGRKIASAPIKGTASTLELMLGKDATENIMITDLVRNDLQRVCEPGTVAVEGLLSPEEHPGLVHLVSTVVGQLRPHVSWREIIGATFPPGSVSGVPKLSALDVIRELEATPRGPYCGAVGWIDADRDEAELAVGIRTFWREVRPRTGRRCESESSPIVSEGLLFGAGAGITWDSDPAGEWVETQLKARRLLAIADGAACREN